MGAPSEPHRGGDRISVDVDVVDVVVVGGGVAGLGAAAALAPRTSVTLVEQEPTNAYHASGRSAATLSETSGHPLVCTLARLSRSLFEHPPDGFADHPLIAPRGLLWVGEADDSDRLDAFADTARVIAPTVRRLDAVAARGVLPALSDDVVAAGAVYEPDACEVDAAALIQGFVRTVRRHGGTLHTSSEVIEVRPLDSADAADADVLRWEVRAGDRRIHTRHVVNAAGAWGDVVAHRAGAAPLGLLPLRRTAAIVRADEQIIGWPLVMDIANRYYFEPEQGGLLVSPADESLSDPCDARADEIDVALAIERVAAATGLPLRSVVHAWAGLRTFAPDRAPVIGEDPDAPGFWWLVGQGGAGIKTAPAAGELLARLIHGEGLTADERDLGITLAAVTPARFR
jgi:D-arginine dehydrogenase